MREHDRDDVAGYEQRDVPARLPFKVIVFMAVFVPVGLLIVWLLMILLWPTIEAPPSPFTEDTTGTPAPRLQTDPPGDYAAFQREIERRLDSVGWVDAEAQVVHLPIEQAKQLLLERGLPEQAESPSHSRIPLDPQTATQWLEAPETERQRASESAEKTEVVQ